MTAYDTQLAERSKKIELCKMNRIRMIDLYIWMRAIRIRGGLYTEDQLCLRYRAVLMEIKNQNENIEL